MTSDELTVFNLTKSQIASMTGIGDRQVQRILKQLESAGIVVTRKNGFNSGGRSLGSERAIKIRPYHPK
ncbi:helix-turn-helix domain-containing protein [Crateriforma conspicua]|uniref:helix-turn-helix domain-containing protein n=1 Tax=Crateriforma conspicua TaxID=2527996 RepID=UPI0036F20EB2